MLKKKSSGGGKKRKNPPSEERHRSSKRRSAESNVVDELADPELDRVGSDIEEGGLDLSVPFKPISAYVSDKKTMLEQCFGVLGEKKLRRMLPELFKDCTLEEIRKVCCEQLDPISERNIMQILSGEEVTKDEDASQSTQQASEIQKDNSVDSTECNEGLDKMDKPQQGGSSSEESDVLSINAADSDIDTPKEEAPVKIAADDGGGEQPKPAEAKKDIQRDIDRSVSEILAPADEAAAAAAAAAVQQRAIAAAAAAATPCQPSLQQLELLELEMRARAIKALMKASHRKDP
ncbi:caspase activity and apoptosis inhibitor 1 isoform X1 [Syngnathus acus]|uniref:caspase activity and apoptosis inhibitor 1 isoform X1 n=1 Tax=Syngnathus acus TaxID=161584 RepID=UPI001885FD78|nr:caspase activity and apoptosis inhibitor 1 isoform X1 [Syngnathus acus]